MNTPNNTPNQVIDIAIRDDQFIRIHNDTQYQVAGEYAQMLAEEAGPHIPRLEQAYLIEFFIFEFASGTIAVQGCLMLIGAKSCLWAPIFPLLDDIDIIVGQCVATAIGMLHKLLDNPELLNKKGAGQTISDHQNGETEGEEGDDPHTEERQPIEPLPKSFEMEDLLRELNKYDKKRRKGE